MSKHFSNKELKEILMLSKDIKQKDIATRFNVSQAFISKLLIKNGIHYKKSRFNLSWLSFDFNYFDNIDSAKKAYWLGFIAADGCLKSNKLRVVSKDREVLEKLKKDLKSKHKIVTNTSFDRRTNKQYLSYAFQLTSKAFADKLNKYIPVNKSFHFNMPKISQELYPEFLAGLMDGDGCFTLQNKKTLRVNLISTKECLVEIQNFLLKKLNIKKMPLQAVTKNKNVWKMHIYNLKDSMGFISLIYRNKDKKMYLDRKQEKINDIILKIQNNT